MSRPRILILLLAIGSAFLAVMLARSMLQPPPAAPVAVEAPKNETVAVLVAAKDLAIGERITALSVEWREWPRSSVTPFMITQEARPAAIDEIRGGRARAPILQGDTIAERNILKPNDGNLMSSQVREGLRAFAIRISERTAGSGFILPNDRVDIISTVRVKLEKRANDDEQREIIFSSTIITNARVLAMNQALAPGGDSASLSDLETALLELDPHQAEVVARAEAQGELSLALRALGDGGDGKSTDDRPAFAALTEAPNSVEIFKQGFRSIYSCDPKCDPVMQTVNAPFPLIVRDAGFPQPASSR